MRRHRMSRRSSRKLFRKGNRVHKRNRRTAMRGGIRM